MVKTGYISFYSQTGGGKDADGNPLAPTPAWTVYIDCNLKTITKEYKFLIDGQYQLAKYSIYINSNTIPSEVVLSSLNQVKLQDNNQNELGKFQVGDLQYLNLSKRVKIIV